MPESNPAPISANNKIKSLTPKWLSRGLAIRVFIYLVGAHLFAAFLYLLFWLGANASHSH
ncbi:DUF6126 family protein [Streptantibioticus ferralitis]|uniref:DUF6126 family protein n=1 Tax=Streptantibioticus ferralitis TaxID=236510 RepID=A0ABT5Z5D6_9ACTN|nr:DUF6126 family protein [Streptantibioticus ferralitis]MDF2258270.1 DUF6126 family protein [Streptantibioticus ferralitis]